MDANLEENQEDRELHRNNEQGASSNALILAASDALRDARIATRKLRTDQARILKSKSGQTNDVNALRLKKAEENKNTSKSKIQMGVSYKHIHQTRNNGNELVTNIQAGVTAREMQRRQLELGEAEMWKMKRNAEMEISKEASAIIDQNWLRLEKMGQPYGLKDQLSKQKDECNAMLAGKDNYIGLYSSVLKTKEEEYVKELKRQSEEIDRLLERMNEQYMKYESTTADELVTIEGAFVQERIELINANSKEVEQLFESRKVSEIKFTNDKEDRVDDQDSHLEKIRVTDSEEYNVVKIKLETDVQFLEQQLQQMSATYQLNMEKLEYNHQVLKKREEENGTILSSQKRKINRLSEHLNVLRLKSTKQEKMFQNENSLLHSDFKNLSEQYKELQKKVQHFKNTDNKKFKDVWSMNEDESKELMRKILQADRIIHEQQLGMKWEEPKEDLLRNIDPDILLNSSSLKNAELAYEATVERKATTHQLGKNEPEDSGAPTSLTALFRDGKSHSKSFKKILELLCNETGFLIEEKLQKLLAPLHKDEQSLMRLDSIFKALGVENMEDIDRLTSLFIVKGKNQDETFIHPDQVMKTIGDFLSSMKSLKFESKPGNIHAQDDELKPSNIVVDIQNDEESNSEFKNLESPAGKGLLLQKQYWERMENVVTDYRTWDAVSKAMKKYNEVLLFRYNLSKEVDSITTQNAELKTLLRKYMNAKVNDELHIPPTHIMLSQAGILPGRPNV